MTDVLQQPIAPVTNTEQAQKSLKAIKSSILYSDRDIVVLNKPANVAIHTGSRNTKMHMQRFFALLRNEEDLQEPSIVHRLDKRVSGAVMLGRNLFSTRHLANAFARHGSPVALQLPVAESRDHFGDLLVAGSSGDETAEDADALRIEKTYWALLSAVPASSLGTIDNHLFIPPDAQVDIDREGDP